MHPYNEGKYKKKLKLVKKILVMVAVAMMAAVNDPRRRQGKILMQIPAVSAAAVASVISFLENFRIFMNEIHWGAAPGVTGRIDWEERIW